MMGSSLLSWKKALNADLIESGSFTFKEQQITHIVVPIEEPPDINIPENDDIDPQICEQYKLSSSSSEYNTICENCSNFNECFDIHCKISDLYPIDFVIKFENTKIFMMVDNVFWHGLGRNLDELFKSEDGEDILVASILMNDVRFAQYCEKNKKTLIRFVDTDVEDFIKGKIDRLEPYISYGDEKLINRFVKNINKSKGKAVKLKEIEIE